MAENDSGLQRLSDLLASLKEQDRVLSQAMNAGRREISMAHFAVIKSIFDKINAYDPDLVGIFQIHGDPAASLAQIRNVIPRITNRINILSNESNANDRTSRASVDKRCVFVVHGRNEEANNALFAFLRSIDLDPIEWEEAIAMTGHGTPYPGQALEIAFSRAQAAIVLLTGDDVARLGTRFLRDSDKQHERELTPQCRPNVIFEAGMALGKYPDRTIIATLGETRQFTDILGRHVVQLTSQNWRHDLSDRLRNAKCDVKTENRRKWLIEGNFDMANKTPDLGSSSECGPLAEENERLEQELAHERAQHNADNSKSELALLDLQAQFNHTRADNAILLRHREEEIDGLRKALATQRNHFERERDELTAALAKAEGEHQQALESTRDSNLKLAALQQWVQEAKTSLPVAPVGMLYPEPTQAVMAHALNLAASTPSVEVTTPSPDEFIARISRQESSTTKGLAIVIINERLMAIGENHLIISSAQSFDSRKNAFRQARTFQPFHNNTAQPIEPSCTGPSIWFIHKRNSHPHLFVGNDDQHPAIWPDNDDSAIQKWLLSFEVIAHTTA